MNKWIIIGILGCGLAAFGYKVYQDQQKKGPNINRGPISVAAVRGSSSQNNLNPVSAGSDSFVDYTQTLKDDTDMARKNIDKYNKSNKEHLENLNKSLAEPGQ